MKWTLGINRQTGDAECSMKRREKDWKQIPYTNAKRKGRKKREYIMMRSKPRVNDGFSLKIHIAWVSLVSE